MTIVVILYDIHTLEFAVYSYSYYTATKYACMQ